MFNIYNIFNFLFGLVVLRFSLPFLNILINVLKDAFKDLS